MFAPLDDPSDVPAGVDLVVTGRSLPLPGNGSVAPVSLSVPGTRRALRTIESAGFDVVNVHEPFAPGLPYGLLTARRLPPMVATFHRSGPSPFYTVLGPLARRLVQRYTVRSAVSESARSTAARALGGVYEVGFNGVDTDRIRQADPWPTARPAILFLGRHEERKGLSILLEAFEALRGEAPPSSPTAPVLWVAGDGPDTASLRRLHPPDENVCWLGVLSESEKARRLAAAEILCAPSLGGESFGIVLLEAMAAGTVVVASDIDGYRQAAGGRAVLVPPGDSVALACALSGVLAGKLAVLSNGAGRSEELGVSTPGEFGPDDPRRRWLSAGRQRAEKMSLQRLGDWYEGLYRSALATARP